MPSASACRCDWARPSSSTSPTSGLRASLAATPKWIRDHAIDILAALEQMFAIDQHGRASSLRRIPHRLHWLLWLLADLDQGQLLDRDRGKA
jgi:hypothetical protein